MPSIINGCDLFLLNCQLRFNHHDRHVRRMVTMGIVPIATTPALEHADKQCLF